MLRNAKISTKSIFIGIVLVVTIIFEITFLTVSDYHYTVLISPGIILGFSLCFGKKILPSSFIIVFLMTFIMSLLKFDYSFIIELTSATVLTVSTIALVLICDYLINRFNCVVIDSNSAGTKYLLIIILVTPLISLIPATYYSYMYDTEFLFELKAFLKPTSTGLLLYSILVVNSTVYDPEFGKLPKRSYLYILYPICFGVIALLTFLNAITTNNFLYVAPIFILLFMLNVFIFNFRMMIVVVSLYIASYSVSLFILRYDDISLITSSTNILLITLTIIMISAKVMFTNIDKQRNEIKDTNSKLESILSSTFDLFRVQDFIGETEEAYVDTYMNKIFTIALKLFVKVDSGICVRTIKNDVHIINTEGYNIESVRQWNLKKGSITWAYEFPIHTTNSEGFFKRIIDTNYEFVKDVFPEIKETLRFVIPLGQNEFGGITLDIHKDSNETFTENDIENLAYLQKLLISFYEKNQLSLKTTSLKDDIVLSLIRTLELFDQYTGGHSEEVADLSKMIAKKMKLPHEQIYNVYWAGIVHDIGKIGIDPLIINKPTRLTVEEYHKVQEHAMNGFSILNRSEDLKEIAILVKHHHEWWNGEGYPDNLKQDKIPFGSQILQVADSVSSMATKRTYSDIKPLDVIKDELIMYKGTQFSPYVANAMIELIEDGTIEDYYKGREK